MTRSILHLGRIATVSAALVLAASAPSPTSSLIGTAYAADAAETSVVEVDGYGADPQQAQENGLREAVQRVVGTFVATDTLMEKGDLLQDKIYAHSRGFVESIDVLDTTTRGKMVVVKMRVAVKKTPLLAAVTPIVQATRAVDGASMGAKLASKLQSEQSGAGLLGTALEGYQQVWRVTLGEPDIAVSGADFKLKIPYTIDVDATAWDAATTRFKAALDAVASRKGRANTGEFYTVHSSELAALYRTIERGDRAIVVGNRRSPLGFEYWIVGAGAREVIESKIGSGGSRLHCRVIASYADGSEAQIGTIENWQSVQGIMASEGAVVAAPAPLFLATDEKRCKSSAVIATPGLSLCALKPIEGFVSDVNITREDVAQLSSLRPECTLEYRK